MMCIVFTAVRPEINRENKLGLRKRSTLAFVAGNKIIKERRRQVIEDKTKT
jgi:hypothetical protein